LYGGGILLGGGTSTLTNVTIVGNNASGNNDDGLYASSEIVYIKNCLIANHANYDFINSSSTLNDNGYNLVENSSNYTWAGTGDITGDQASLNISGSLALNGSLYGTHTLALLAGSVAINAGDFGTNNTVSVTGTDQRGYFRNGAADIGAYEYDGLSEAPTFTLTYSTGIGGSISGDTPQTVSLGESGSAVTAVADTGYNFVNWSDSSTANPRTDTNVSSNISVTANFEVATYSLEYTSDGNGTISGNSSQTVNHGSDGSEVEAVANTGYHFLRWSDESTANPRTDSNVTGNISVTAIFEINTYTLTYTAGPNGSITGETVQTVNHGSNGAEVTAVPDSNYAFLNWSDDSVENPRTDLLVEEDISVTATFEIINSEAPQKLNFKINNGDNYTNTKDTGLTIEAQDDQNEVSEMIVCNNADFTGCEWENYQTTKSWELTGGDGVKNVYIKFKDSVGNESLASSDSIILDTEISISQDETDFTITDEGSRTTYNQRPVFSGRGEIGATVTIIINSNPITGTTTVDSNRNWSWTPDQDIPLGEHTVTITTQDQAGNSFQISYPLEVLVQQLPESGQQIPMNLITLFGGLILSIAVFRNSNKYKRDFE
ncbi:MAG: InlB B-repeat-containing protein, partial [Candidatus Dojkabacteria bacterium]|nr:InlB B-repeat-containing protein [Candidatus Dojkabacteria bacterium]